MAEPQIKSALESPELTTKQNKVVSQRLSACLASDANNIRPGAVGDHVKAVQDALELLRQRMPDLGLLPITDTPGSYKKSTADAVRKYKEINVIQRTGQKLDDIVGRMTITQIDNDLVNGPKPAPPEPAVINAPVEIATARDNPGKDDLTSGPVKTDQLSGKQLRLVIDMRNKSTSQLEELMLSELRLGDSKFGPLLAKDFFANKTAPDGDQGITHAVGSDFSNLVAGTEVFRALALDFRRKLDKHIKELAANGPFNPVMLAGRVPPPIPSWSPAGIAQAGAAAIGIFTFLESERSKMLVLVGSFQGSRVFLNDFVMDPTTRRYTGTLLFQLVDHFGVDTDDIVFDFRGHGSEGQVAFWVLQHERHPGHMPYRLKVVIRETIDGSF